MSKNPGRPWLLFRSLQGAAPTLHYDLIAGLTMAAIAVPEQMATARLGGFPPYLGFYVFVAGSLGFALLGANRFLSSGADSTITPIFAASLALIAAAGTAQYAVLAALLALLVGLLLLGAGFFRAGWIANLLSIPVMTGFLAGIAVHIALSQAPAFLGLPGGEGNVFRRLQALAGEIGHFNPLALAIGSACLALIVAAEKLSPRLPGALVALGGATAAVLAFNLEQRGVAVIGAFHVEAPHPALPMVGAEDFVKVLGLAAIIALVVMVQSAATSRSFAGLPGEEPDINRDFLGLGAGSLLAGLFGGFPVDASPPRTAIVAETGGRSQVAGMAAAAAIVLVAAYGEAFLRYTPEAALAAILLFVAARIFRVKQMRAIARQSRPEFALTLITMLAVVFLPVQTGVALAIMFSLLHGLWTTTQTSLHTFERLPGETVWWPESPACQGETLAGVKVVGFQAPLSFLNAQKFQRELEVASAEPGLRLLVLEASSIDAIDYTAAQSLAEAIKACQAKGVIFAMARLESLRARATMADYGLLDALGGADKLFHSVDEATRRLAPEARVVKDKERQGQGSAGKV